MLRTQNELHGAGDFDLFGWFKCKTIFFISFFFLETMVIFSLEMETAPGDKCFNIIHDF